MPAYFQDPKHARLQPIFVAGALGTMTMTDYDPNFGSLQNGHTVSANAAAPSSRHGGASLQLTKWRQGSRAQRDMTVLTLSW